MRRTSLGLIASVILLPIISLAQTTPQPPASWIAFQQQESVKRAAFNKEMKADRDAFLNANPEVKTYFEQMHAARAAAWKAHPRRTTTP